MEWGARLGNQFSMNQADLMPPTRPREVRAMGPRLRKQTSHDGQPLPRTTTPRLLPEEMGTRTRATMSTTSPCHTGGLVNNHHSHNDVMTDTVPLWHAMPSWRGNKTPTTILGRAYKSKDKTGWIVDLPPLGLSTTRVGGTLYFCMFLGPHGYIRGAGPSF
jgi:hypothetical protein